MKTLSLPNMIINNLKYFSSWIAYALYHLGPLIVTIKGRLVLHAVVIKGIENETLLIHDPWHGSDQYVKFSNFFKIFDKNNEIFMYLPNRSLNKIYPTRETELVINLTYCDCIKPIPLLKSSDIIKPISV
ncbi:papain-like cysteine protease family protein [Fluviispira vulneris]|uniref:papain-like cysteine protease family protein n=1 Tax=Fluviispira vulneris TaxID=2763012 RepID=UPI001648C052